MSSVFKVPVIKMASAAESVESKGALSSKNEHNNFFYIAKCCEDNLRSGNSFNIINTFCHIFTENAC